MRERPRGVALPPPDFASLHPGYNFAQLAFDQALMLTLPPTPLARLATLLALGCPV